MKQPQEGTVLTVCKDWLSEANRLSSETRDFVLLLKESVKAAHDALSRTPELLDILKKHRVVDAGGKAFVLFLEGIQKFIENGSIRKLWVKGKATAAGDIPAEPAKTLPYCVECCVRRPNLDRVKLVDKLSSTGEDLIFYGSKDFAKIRINTDNPDNIFSTAEEHGEISAKNILPNEMDPLRQVKKPIAFVADTTCDIADEFIENNDIYFVPIKVQAEDRVYTDKLDIVQEEFYEIMASSSVLPKTSQPSLLDFSRVYESLLNHYESVISVHLASGLSGTFQTALQAARNVDPQRIAVIDSKNVSVGLGLIVIEGLRAYKNNLSKESILDCLENSIPNTNIFVGIPTLKYLIQGGRVTKAKGLIAKIFNINPIISVNKEGMIEAIGKTIGRQSLERKILELAFKMIEKEIRISLAVVHSNAPDLAAQVADKLSQHTGQVVEMVMNASPVLGAHVGPGAVAIAVLKGGRDTPLG